MNAAQHILVFCVRVYRWVISPAKTVLFGPLGQCRFTPSCSEYALGALRSHGALAGSWLALKRIGRCHPWGGCGHDPVPAAVGMNGTRWNASLPGSGAQGVQLQISTLQGQLHSQRH